MKYERAVALASARRKIDSKGGHQQLTDFEREVWQSHIVSGLGRRRKHRPKSQDARAKLVARAKARPCADCKGSYPAHVMDLDHLPERGPKSFSLSAWRGHTKREVEVELLKVEAVCANCHRERTFLRRIRQSV